MDKDTQHAIPVCSQNKRLALDVGAPLLRLKLTLFELGEPMNSKVCF